MKKKRNLIIKICSALLLCFTFIISFACKSYAWYIDNNGNLQSSNLLPHSHGITLNERSTTFNVDFVVNETYTFSIQNGSGSGQYALVLYNDSVRVETLTGGTNWDLSFTFTVSSVSNRLYIYANNIVNVDLMLNVGSTALDYDFYGTWYSQTNYDNYYNTGYGVGYNAGINHAYNQLGSTIISPLVSGSSIGKYDTNNVNFISRTNITDVYVNGDYYFLDWSADADYWYHITLGWNDYYIIKDVGFTPSSFYQVIVTVNGIDFSNINYNGSHFGVFNIQDTTMTPVNEITISVKMRSSDFDGVNLYVSSFNNGIEDVQEAFNNGYEQGIKTGKDSGYKLGYEDGYSEGSTQENTGRKLIWTIAATPFESFKTIWNVDVLGLNISGIILGLLMALLVIYLIKKHNYK